MRSSSQAGDRRFGPARPGEAAGRRLRALVPRKGQDVLLRAWPSVLRAVPDAVLLLVGGGPYRSRLERLANAVGVRRSVILTGSVPWADLPAYYDAGNVFAMPCRTRAGGLDVGPRHRLPGSVGDRSAGRRGRLGEP